MPTALSLPQLLDLSLGTPEVGAVNFNSLHKLLGAIIRKLDLGDHHVDLEDALPGVSASAKLGSIHAFPSDAKDYTGPKNTSYHNLQEKVSRMERDLSALNALPSSKDMVHKVKSEQPLTDLWQYMQLSKKVEANDEGVRTAMNLIQQLISDMKDMKKDQDMLKDKLSKLDIDALNEKLKKIDEMSAQMKDLSGIQEQLKELDSLRNQLEGIQNALNAFPAPEEIVTWPGLEDAMNGVRGEFASYRADSKMANASEHRATAMTPQARAATPAAPMTPAAAPITPNNLDTSGQVSAASVLSRPKSAVSDGPSTDQLGILERLGTIDRRHGELKKRVDDLELEIGNKANKDEMGTKLPDDLLDKIDDLTNKVTEIDHMRTKLYDLEILLADMPETGDIISPQRGDKSRASSIFSVAADSPSTSPTKMRSETPGLDSQYHNPKPDQTSRRRSVTEQKNISMPRKQSSAAAPSSVSSTRQPHPPTQEPPSSNDKPRRERKFNPSIQQDESVEPDQDMKTPAKEDDSPDVKKHATPAVQNQENMKKIATQDRQDIENAAVGGTENSVTLARESERTGQPIDRKQSKGERTQKGSQPQQHRETFNTYSPDNARKEPTASTSRQAGEKTPDQGQNEVVEDDAERNSEQPSVTIQSASKSKSRNKSDDDSLTLKKNLQNINARPATENSSASKTRTGGKTMDRTTTPSNQGGEKQRPIQSMDISERRKQRSDSPPNASPNALRPEGSKHSNGGLNSSDEKHSASQNDVDRRSSISRYSRTLREVVAEDYMGEIEKLKKRIDLLEREKASLMASITVTPRSPEDASRQMAQYASGVDEEKLNHLVRQFTHINDELNRRMNDVDAEVASFLDAGIGATDNDAPEIVMVSRDSGIGSAASTSSSTSRKLHNALYSGTSDADSLKRAQQAIMDLQAEIENLQKMTDFLSKENEDKTKTLEELNKETTRLDVTKADKDYIDAELDAKADKSQVDSKVSRTTFDSAVTDLQRMVDDLLSKLLAYEDAWKKAHGKLEEDVEQKLDRGELERLKTYIDKKLKDINAKLKQSQGAFNPFCEDAAGLKRQLLPFNCLSCDKPVTVSSSNPAYQNPAGDGFSAKGSTRPYTTYELDQIRQHAKRIYNGERPHVHSLLNADSLMDYYSAPRSCGGTHTMTYPHKRVIKSAYKNMFPEPEEIPPEVVLPVRDETDILGADGHIYRGRMDSKDQLDARMPTTLEDTRPTTPTRPKTSPGKRPGSARIVVGRPNSARPSSARASTSPLTTTVPAAANEEPAPATLTAPTLAAPTPAQAPPIPDLPAADRPVTPSGV